VSEPAFLWEEGYKDELLDGKIVVMSPRPRDGHLTTTGNICRIFGNYLRKKPCRVYSEKEVFLTKKDRFIPDVIIVCNKDINKIDGVYGSPDLVAEVLSSSTMNNDKGYKKNVYERCGVKEYWIVDVKSRAIEVYLLENGRYELDMVYVSYPDYELELMNEDEKNKIVKEFKTSLFDDLTISVDEIFENLIDF
jgi:Uma2 family endonuclease